jgi:hypothetical protein
MDVYSLSLDFFEANRYIPTQYYHIDRGQSAAVILMVKIMNKYRKEAAKLSVSFNNISNSTLL